MMPGPAFSRRRCLALLAGAGPAWKALPALAAGVVALAGSAGSAASATPMASRAPDAPGAPGSCSAWPEWDGFARAFVADTGRVIDPGPHGGLTTSEGQSYALFFALVADDRLRFEQVLRWTEDNLAGGDLTARLPAWSWGKRSNGSWAIIDVNPASDADLWIAYVLQEAGRLWQKPKYTGLGQLLAERILREETAVLDGLGRLLLPAPKGFQTAPNSARFNPSYVPLQLLRRLAAGSVSDESKAQWTQQVGNATRMIVDSAPRGFSPDWVAYSTTSGFMPDSQSDAVGTFDAIRTYLWAGMLAPGDPARTTLQKALLPMARVTAATGTPPLRIDTRNGTVQGVGNAGFSAALLPLISSTLGASAAGIQQARIRALDPLARKDNYYEQALTLFGLGWADGRYRFDRDGTLRLGQACSGR